MSIKPIPEKYISWRRSFALATAFILLWWVVGNVLSFDFFDSDILRSFKLIDDKSDALSFLSVIFAIQIPIFILFLEQMVKARHVKKVVFPKITGFKDIVIGLIIGAVLTLIAPRESFLYLPIAILVGINIVAIFKAITLTFHQEQYGSNILRHLRKVARTSFKVLVSKRTNNNAFFKELDTIPFIKLSYIDQTVGEDMVKLKVSSRNSGYLKSVNLKLLTAAMIGAFPELDPKPTRAKKSTTNLEARPQLLLHYFPANRIKSGSYIAEVIIPKTYKRQSRLQGKIGQAFKIENSPDAPIKYFDEIISAFENGFREVLKDNRIESLDELLELFDAFVEEFDQRAKDETNDDKTYRLEQAMAELRRFSEDDLGKRLYRIFELYNATLDKAIEEGNEELEDKLVGFIYGKMLNISTEENQTSIARWDQLLMSAINQYVYSNNWNKDLSLRQESIRDDLLFHLKEHTELLVYRLEQLNEDGELKNNKTFLYDWVQQRIQRMRTILLVSFKNDHQVIFNKVLNIFIKIDSDVYYDRLDNKTYRFVRSNIFMVYAYLHYNKALDTEYGKSIRAMIRKWQPKELFGVFIECVEKDYADKWHIDTLDHAADGVVRMVPDYDDVLRALWVDLMLEKPSVPSDPDYYAEKTIFEKTTIFTGGQDEGKDKSWITLIDESGSSQAQELKALIKKFAKIRYDWETQKLVSETLDQAKVAKFRELVNKAYNEASIAKKVFTSTRHYKVEPSFKQSGFRRIGINQVFDKEAFISDWHSGYVTDFMAEEVGRSTATQQDKAIFTELFKMPNSVSEIDDILKNLKNKGGRWLVVGNNVHTWQTKQLYEQYMSKRPDYNEIFFKGVRQALPLQTVYIEELPTGIFFVSMSDIGLLTRKPHKFIDDEIEVLISAYSEDTKALKLILRQSPKWLQAKGSQAEQRNFLLKKVRLITDRVFKYDPPSISTVYLLKMIEE